MLLFPAACGRSSTFVCTGQSLVRARVVLWCTSGLVSMKHFAIVSLRIYCIRGVFFHLFSVFFRHVFLQPEPTLDLYVWNKNDSTSDNVLDTCAHPYLYSTAVRIYYDTTTLLQQCYCMYSGYTSRDSVYYCCACARTRYIYILSYILCKNKQQQQQQQQRYGC